MIDWQDICNGWNRQSGYRHSIEEMFEHLYAQMGSMEKIAEYLGVAATTVAIHMDKLGVDRKRKTPMIGSVKWKLDKLTGEQFASMTAKQLARYASCTVPTIHKYVHKSRRDYVREKNGYTVAGKTKAENAREAA